MGIYKDVSVAKLMGIYPKERKAYNDGFDHAFFASTETLQLPYKTEKEFKAYREGFEAGLLCKPKSEHEIQEKRRAKKDKGTAS